MKVNLIGSAYMANDDTPNLVVSYKQFNELMKAKSPIEITEFISRGRDASEATDNIFSDFGIKRPKCPHCFQPKDTD